jgi:hypothetical protein
MINIKISNYFFGNKKKVFKFEIVSVQTTLMLKF